MREKKVLVGDINEQASILIILSTRIKYPTISQSYNTVTNLDKTRLYNLCLLYIIETSLQFYNVFQ